MNIVLNFYKKNFKITVTNTTSNTEFKTEKIIDIKNNNKINIFHVLKKFLNNNKNRIVNNLMLFFHDLCDYIKNLKIVLPHTNDLIIKYMFSKNCNVNIKYKHTSKNYKSIVIENLKPNSYSFIPSNFFKRIKTGNLVLSGFRKLNLSKIKVTNEIFITNIDYIYGKLKINRLNKLKIMFVENISNNFIKSLNKINIVNLYLLNIEKIDNIILNKKIKNVVINEVKAKNIYINNLNFVYYENYYLLNNNIEKVIIKNVNEVILGLEFKENYYFFIENINKLKLKFLIYDLNETMNILENLNNIKKTYENTVNILKIKLNIDIGIIGNKNLKNLLEKIKKEINTIHNFKNIEISNLEKKLTGLICDNLSFLINNSKNNINIPKFVFKHCKNKISLNTLLI